MTRERITAPRACYPEVATRGHGPRFPLLTDVIQKPSPSQRNAMVPPTVDEKTLCWSLIFFLTLQQDTQDNELKVAKSLLWCPGLDFNLFCGSVPWTSAVRKATCHTMVLLVWFLPLCALRISVCVSASLCVPGLFSLALFLLFVLPLSDLFLFYFRCNFILDVFFLRCLFIFHWERGIKGMDLGRWGSGMDLGYYNHNILYEKNLFAINKYKI